MMDILAGGAVGMLEYTSIAAGMESADIMVKTADVTPIFFKTICPGKFLAAITGNVAAVEAAVSAGREIAPETVADGFVIPNIHSDVISAMSGCIQIKERAALGVVETFSVAASVKAADAAAKASDVQILEVRTALGLGGKAFVLIGGDVAAVQAAVDAAAYSAGMEGLLVRKTVIPRPSDAFFDQIM